jgi:hypothetical protein
VILHRELEIRQDIVNKSVYKAKELNLKRAVVRSLDRQVDQFTECVPKFINYKDIDLLPKMKYVLPL